MDQVAQRQQLTFSGMKSRGDPPVSFVLQQLRCLKPCGTSPRCSCSRSGAARSSDGMRQVRRSSSRSSGSSGSSRSSGGRRFMVETQPGTVSTECGFTAAATSAPDTRYKSSTRWLLPRTGPLPFIHSSSSPSEPSPAHLGPAQPIPVRRDITVYSTTVWSFPRTCRDYWWSGAGVNKKNHFQTDLILTGPNMEAGPNLSSTDR